MTLTTNSSCKKLRVRTTEVGRLRGRDFPIYFVSSKAHHLPDEDSDIYPEPSTFRTRNPAATMPVLDPILSAWFSGLDIVIARGVHFLSFKNAAFQSQIAETMPYTPVIDALNIMIRSPDTSAEEKKILMTCRDLYDRLFYDYGREYSENNIRKILKMPESSWKSMVATDFDHRSIAESLEDLEEMFNRDRTGRGIRIPSRGYQLVDLNGIVTHTIFFDMDRYQVCLGGDPFYGVQQEQDYYEVPNMGPNGETLRYLTSRFMLDQGFQTFGTTPGPFFQHLRRLTTDYRTK